MVLSYLTYLLTYLQSASGLVTVSAATGRLDISELEYLAVYGRASMDS